MHGDGGREEAERGGLVEASSWGEASSYLTFDFACPSLTGRPAAAGFYSQGRSVPHRTLVLEL